ncbi:MAG: aminotransferase class I/II-fold pyridoxal phosphate-dependent enzyme, partial [Candidatus Nitrotoga sp.]
MNPNLDRLQPYPFQKLATLFGEVTPNAAYQPINLSIGEPKHATPPLIIDALCANMAGLANYPTTSGSDTLRHCIAQWISQRYELPILNAKTEVIPVNGSREALFAFA